MSVFNQILVVLSALAGFGFGYSLTYVTPSEAVTGRRYFEWLEKAFFLGAFVPLIFYGVSGRHWLWSGAALMLAGGLFFLPLWARASIFAAFFSIVLFFVTPGDIAVHILQGTLVFLYGLPAGTLLRSTKDLDVVQD